MNENIITLLNYVVTYIYSESVGKHLGTYINKIKSVRLPRMGVIYKKFRNHQLAFHKKSHKKTIKNKYFLTHQKTYVLGRIILMPKDNQKSSHNCDQLSENINSWSHILE